ncbi:hypothetical protein [Pedobacter sp. ASV28]|uniref:hypothetical protein n=1 Tax=Pedobacter sp. ASV28 TaxID=2795123 RepID=UPI0018EDF509|nr:hypothetical protein [Pedobacter sp. ASV28]
MCLISPLLLADITILKDEGKLSLQHNDIILINYAELLKPKIIKRKLAEAKALFVDTYIGFSQHIFDNAKDPVLYIDNQKIHHTEIRAAIKQLNVRHLAYLFKKTHSWQFIMGKMLKIVW